MISISGDSTLSLSGLASLDVDNININGNTISSTDTNGNIVISPDGTGKISSTADLDLATGKVIKVNNIEILSDIALGASVVSSSLTSVGTLTALQVDNININGNTIISTDTNGDIVLTPDGVGDTIINSNLLIGGSTAITDGTKSIGIFSGTAPTAVAADSIAIYSSDVTAGNTTLSLFTEGTPVAAVSPTAPDRTIAIKINGTIYYLHAKTTND